MFKKLAGFSIIGAISTLCSMLLMYLFHNIFKWHYQVSYVASYVIPLFLSFLLNSIFVFKSYKNTRNLIVYFSIYLSSMLTGMVLLSIYRLFIPLDDTLLSYLTLPVTMAQNFTLSHFLLKKKEIQ
ncbi:MAG TPA: GtrA family protein [Cytophagaceae bacterium]|nr:GtrA family protein [Cytophagaceae bacterium]